MRKGLEGTGLAQGEPAHRLAESAGKMEGLRAGSPGQGNSSEESALGGGLDGEKDLG